MMKFLILLLSSRQTPASRQSADLEDHGISLHQKYCIIFSLSLSYGQFESNVWHNWEFVTTTRVERKLQYIPPGKTCWISFSDPVLTWKIDRLCALWSGGMREENVSTLPSCLLPDRRVSLWIIRLSITYLCTLSDGPGLQLDKVSL